MESTPLQQREPNIPRHLQQADFDPYIKQRNFSCNVFSIILVYGKLYAFIILLYIFPAVSIANNMLRILS